MLKFTMRGLVVALAVTMLVAFTGFLWAQTPTGSIRGSVVDPSGAVIPNASVKVTEAATGRLIELKTSSDGVFVAPLLLPGEYTVRVQAEQFAPADIQVTVEAGQTAMANAKLKLGSASTQVEVTAMGGEVHVDTARSTVDGVITARQIDQMPMNARNFLELAAMQPGVQIADGGNIDPTKSETYRTIQILGRSGTGTRVTVDGIDITDETVGTTNANISDDAVQEFQLSQSSLDLSTSLTSSGAVNIVTRSGTNTVHGSAFEFYRNQDMGARLGFSDKSQPFHRHQVGFRVGGPVVKDKLFWFANWERTYQGTQGSTVSDLNFPTVAGHDCRSGCFAAVPLGIRMADGRLDYNLKSNVRLFYRFGHDWNVSTGGNIPVSPFQNVDWNNNHTVGLDWSQSRFTHSIRFGYVKFNNRIITQSFSGFAFPTTPDGTPYNLAVGSYLLGPNGLAPQATAQDNYDMKYDGTFVRGKHVLRYGGEFDHIVLGGFANFAGPLAVTGNFSAVIQQGLIAAGLDPTNPVNYPLSEFSGGPDNGFFTLDACDGFPHGCHRNNRFAWYAGDTWRARHNLTLNFGTRWEYDTGYLNDEHNITRPSILDYWIPGASKHPTMGYNKFGPQVGFAWDPTGGGKTIIRGGGYMAYEMNIYNNLLFDQNALIPAGIGPDIKNSEGWTNPDGSAVSLAQANINPASLPASCQGADALAAMNTGGDYSCLQGNPISSTLGVISALNTAMKNAYKNFNFTLNGPSQFLTEKGFTFGALFAGNQYKVPYSLQWNIGVQREVRPGHLLTVDFLVNHGVHVGNLEQEMECRRCASTLNAAIAAGRIGAVTGGDPTAVGSAAWMAAINNYIATTPGATLSDFSLASDSVFTGRTPDPTASDPILRTTNFTRARFIGDGGFSMYRGLQVRMQGRFANKWHVLKNANYLISYALGDSEASVAAYRTEFLNLAPNKFNPSDRTFFGPVPEDHRHMVTASLLTDTPLGFRISQFWRFYTPSPGTIWLPELGGLSGPDALFSTDLLGTGNSVGADIIGTVLPGTRMGQFGRQIGNWQQLNQIIGAYNANYAGQLTPAGQALVNAGLFTTAQMAALGGVMPKIPAVPVTNPWPFQNFFNLDVGVSRPVKLSRVREGMSVEPWIQFFNVLNYNTLGAYGSALSVAGFPGGNALDTTFGSLNFDYLNPANQASCTATGNCIQDLRQFRQRQNSTRLFQIGVRFNF